MTRARYLMEMACAFVCAGLAVLTIAVHDWIEVVFGVNPDGGSGLWEAAITLTLALTCVALSADVVRLHRLERARA